jgi:hypothetical protein
MRTRDDETITVTPVLRPRSALSSIFEWSFRTQYPSRSAVYTHDRHVNRVCSVWLLEFSERKKDCLSHEDDLLSR